MYQKTCTVKKTNDVTSSRPVMRLSSHLTLTPLNMRKVPHDLRNKNTDWY